MEKYKIKSIKDIEKAPERIKAEVDNYVYRFICKYSSEYTFEQLKQVISITTDKLSEFFIMDKLVCHNFIYNDEITGSYKNIAFSLLANEIQASSILETSNKGKLTILHLASLKDEDDSAIFNSLSDKIRKAILKLLEDLGVVLTISFKQWFSDIDITKLNTNDYLWSLVARRIVKAFINDYPSLVDGDLLNKFSLRLLRENFVEIDVLSRIKLRCDGYLELFANFCADHDFHKEEADAIAANFIAMPLSNFKRYDKIGANCLNIVVEDYINPNFPYKFNGEVTMYEILQKKALDVVNQILESDKIGTEMM